MSDVIEKGLAHFRAKLNRHLKIVNACYAEIARLEALRDRGNPTTGAVDGGDADEFEEVLAQLDPHISEYIRETRRN